MALSAASVHNAWQQEVISVLGPEIAAQAAHPEISSTVALGLCRKLIQKLVFELWFPFTRVDGEDLLTGVLVR